ncbi:MAG: hypothetical protein ABSH20_30675 [Tepidisphaeraceae bacterium]
MAEEVLNRSEVENLLTAMAAQGDTAGAAAAPPAAETLPPAAPKIRENVSP